MSVAKVIAELPLPSLFRQLKKNRRFGTGGLPSGLLCDVFPHHPNSFVFDSNTTLLFCDTINPLLLRIHGDELREILPVARSMGERKCLLILEAKINYSFFIFSPLKTFCSCSFVAVRWQNLSNIIDNNIGVDSTHLYQSDFKMFLWMDCIVFGLTHFIQFNSYSLFQFF